MAIDIAPLHGFPAEIQFSLGFAKPSPKNHFGHPSSFGSPGSGESFGFADPKAKVGYGYVLNRSKRHRPAQRNVSIDWRDRSAPRARRAIQHSAGFEMVETACKPHGKEPFKDDASQRHVLSPLTTI